MYSMVSMLYINILTYLLYSLLMTTEGFCKQAFMSPW